MRAVAAGLGVGALSSSGRAATMPRGTKRRGCSDMAEMVQAEVSTPFRATTSHVAEGDLTNSILIVPPGIFKSWADADTPKERSASMGVQLLAILPRLLSGIASKSRIPRA
jgi:hypothetical protein